MAEFFSNLRYAIRALGRNRGFTCVAVLSLALGIGANTAIFTLINAMLLRDLPVREPERLVRLRVVRGDRKIPFSYPMFKEVERGQRVFDDMTAWAAGGIFNTEIGGTFSQSYVQTVTCNAHEELGALPLFGRLLQPQDCQKGGAQVAVLGYEFWKRRFGGNPNVMATQIRIEGRLFTIIGITHRWFTGVRTGEAPDITLPLTAQPLLERSDFSMDNRAFLWLSPVARLKKGVSVEQARAQLQSFWPGVLQATASTQTPGLRRQTFLSMGLEVSSIAKGMGGALQEQFTRPLYVLAAIVALILVVACVNLANLLLARSAARQQEMSVRMAIGASRWSIVRQVLTESFTLSFAGALLGLAFSYWCCRLLIGFMSEATGMAVSLNLNPDLRVLFLTMATAALVGALFGVAPAWFSSREDPAQVLQRNARTLGAGPSRVARLLISLQVALSLVLLIGSVLLVRTFQFLRTSDLGVRREGVLEVMLNPRPGGYEQLELNAYHNELIRRLSGLPGVEGACFSSTVVPSPSSYREAVSLAGSDPNSGVRVIANSAAISPGFFRSLGISILNGRDFQNSDDDHHPPVVIVSANLADELFPDADAVGRTIRFGFLPEYQTLTIVGVVPNARIFDPDGGSASPAIYFSSLWKPEQAGTILVRTHGSPEILAGTIAHELDALGREYAVRTLTLDQLLGQELIQQRLTAMLSSFFALLALLLAAIGVYGVMNYGVTRRTREIGIRTAVGAQRAQILWSVLREALSLSLIGILIGVPCSLAASHVLKGMFVGVSPNSISFLSATALVLLLLALAAAYIPARRATQIDPILALRSD